MSRYFLTGAAGFIGSTASERLLKEGHDLVVLDNFNDYYDPALKEKNVRIVKAIAKEHGRKYTLIRGDMRDAKLLDKIFAENTFDGVISWAAMAGVRPSIEDPRTYVEVNVLGLTNLLEAMRQHDCKKLVFISSSSVYGNNQKVPFSEQDPVDRPISPYAATKKAGEVLCHTYHALFDMDIHCLRYFTVYGPRQRPDLAINKFTRLLLEGEKIPMFGDGSTSRDYTYVDDIVEGTLLSLHYLEDHQGVYDIFNLGGSHPISLKDLIAVIGKEVGVEPVIEQLPMQPGDVERTYSDFSHAKEILGYDPQVRIEEGIHRFVEWYRKEYGPFKGGYDGIIDLLGNTTDSLSVTEVLAQIEKEKVK
ncbi:MAG: GDP-mannose 4,6-dehydratase [Erysipelotrichaceae bacterium]|nr:GDP-mannose 4,6-dehydratase [Erysipelotrichaceae bacterium]